MLVSYKFESPPDMNISPIPPNYVEIKGNSTNPMYLYVTPSETMANGTYTINVWAESQEKIGGKNVMSDKYPLYVTVLINPAIPTTTTTTTTITTTTTTTLLEEKIRELLTKKENLALLFVITLVILMIIPYLSFKEEETIEKNVETTEKDMNI